MKKKEIKIVYKKDLIVDIQKTIKRKYGILRLVIGDSKDPEFNILLIPNKNLVNKLKDIKENYDVYLYRKDSNDEITIVDWKIL